MSDLRIESIGVRRTARVARLGPEGTDVRELWYVLHGYGQLAPAFIEEFRVIDDGTRLIVAPEALSRFYNGDLESRIARKGPVTVGASWMTSEERLVDIGDNLDYLDALHVRTTALLRGATPKVTLLGFSQGGATATRWAARGTVPFDRVVVWGAAIAHDVDLADPDSALRRPETIVVYGTRDRITTPEAVAGELARLTAASFPVRQLPFAGGHRLDRDTLRQLAAESAALA